MQLVHFLDEEEQKPQLFKSPSCLPGDATWSLGKQAIDLPEAKRRATAESLTIYKKTPESFEFRGLIYGA